jgi:multidrug transporter EmrE-like cation transporter
MGESNLAWPSIPYALMRIFWNGWALSAIFCFVASMVLWIKVIASMELSRAYPSVSISYIMVFLFSVLFFKEAVSGSKLLGFSMILAGVFFLHR